MLLAGDEMGRSQNGNNNGWCQDNDLGWLNWADLEQNSDLHQFFCDLIAFRQYHSLLRPRHFEGEEKGERRLAWHGVRLGHVDWSEKSSSLGMHLQGHSDEAEIYLIAHAAEDAADFALPTSSKRASWRRFADTALSAEQASCVPGEESEVADQQLYRVQGRSVVVLVR